MSFVINNNSTAWLWKCLLVVIDQTNESIINDGKYVQCHRRCSAEAGPSEMLHYIAVRLWREWAAHRGGKGSGVFALAFSGGYTCTSMTPLFSLKTQPVARQQEHAVTGMLGFFERPVGVWINPPAFADDSMLACPSKANQATMLLPCALLKRRTHPGQDEQDVLGRTYHTPTEMSKKSQVRFTLFYNIWTVIWPCLEKEQRQAEAALHPPTHTQGSTKTALPIIIPIYTVTQTEQPPRRFCFHPRRLISLTVSKIM